MHERTIEEIEADIAKLAGERAPLIPIREKVIARGMEPVREGEDPGTIPRDEWEGFKRESQLAKQLSALQAELCALHRAN